MQPPTRTRTRRWIALLVAVAVVLVAFAAFGQQTGGSFGGSAWGGGSSGGGSSGGGSSGGGSSDDDGGILGAILGAILDAIFAALWNAMPPWLQTTVLVAFLGGILGAGIWHHVKRRRGR